MTYLRKPTFVNYMIFKAYYDYKHCRTYLECYPNPDVAGYATDLAQIRTMSFTIINKVSIREYKQVSRLKESTRHSPICYNYRMLRDACRNKCGGCKEPTKSAQVRTTL